MQQMLYQNIFTVTSVLLITMSNYILFNQHLTFYKYTNILLLTNLLLFLVANIIIAYTNIVNIKNKKMKVKPIITIYINIYLLMVSSLIITYIYSSICSLIHNSQEYSNSNNPIIIEIYRKLYSSYINNIINIITITSIMLIPIFFMYSFIIIIFNKINEIIQALLATQRDNYKLLIAQTNNHILESHQLILIINNIIKNMAKNRQQITMSQRSLAWSDITRTIKHEINNPLTPIKITTSLLYEKFFNSIQKNKQLFTDYLNVINNNIYKISKILDHYSENELKPHLTLLKTSLIPILQNIIKNQSVIYPNIKFNLKYNLESIIIHCNTTQIVQIFINLIKNAQEALHDTKHPQITIMLTQTTHTLTITIKDNGPGFYDLNMLNALESSTTQRINQGIGIGLATTYNIIAKHQGKFNIQNHYSGDTIKGAIITIQLPINYLYQLYKEQNKRVNNDKIA